MSSISTSPSAGCAAMTQVSELDAVVAGDAAITFAWQVSVPPSPGRTSKLLGAVEPEGRFGGCAPGVALALAELGHRVALVSWLGDDDYGRAYLTYLQSGHVDTAGVEIAAGQSSARALMLYDAHGSATCPHHPSGAVLAMTDGRAGCRVIWPEGDAVIPANPIEVEDPTGVGDAFFAAWLSATIRGQSPPQAAQEATAYASTFLQRRAATPVIAQPRRDIS